MAAVNKETISVDKATALQNSDVLEIVGLLSDTHGVMEESATAILGGSTRLVIHAGDVGDCKRRTRLPASEVLRRLRDGTGKEVISVRGNVDEPHDSGISELLETQQIIVAGKRILVLHVSGFPPKQISAAQEVVEACSPDIVIFGHSHNPGVMLCGETLYINPGSAGPRRFKLPRCVALLSIFVCGGMKVQFFSLEPLDEAKLPSVSTVKCRAVKCPRCGLTYGD